MKSFKQILNYIFCQDDTNNVSEDKQEAPVATLPKDEYDGIGEPIKSFLECFKSNPKRFKFGNPPARVFNPCNTCIDYKLTDSCTGIIYILTIDLFRPKDNYFLKVNIAGTTLFSQKELHLVCTIIETITRNRKDNIALHKQQKLMKVYCNGPK